MVDNNPVTKASPSPTAPAPRSTSAPATPPTTTKLTRDDLIRLGQASRPWDFLPLAAQALELLPSDLALRFLTAANLARLGLRTLAQSQLSLLPPTDPDIIALTTAVASLPDDRIAPSARESTTRANLASLHARNLLTNLDLNPWLASLTSTDYFKTLDGNTITRPAGNPALRAASGLLNLTAQAAGTLAQLQHNDPANLHRVVLDGLSPHLLKALYNLTPPGPAGFQPRIIITHTDLHELLDALSTTNLTRELADPRVELFLGPTAGQDLRATLLSRLATALPKFVLPSPTLRTPAAPPTFESVTHALDARQAEFESLRAKVFARYSTRTCEHWRAHFLSADRSCSSHSSENAPSPLRILIPTTRHSTVIQHAAKDLTNAFNRMGHHAHLMIEDDPYANFSSLAYLRLLDTLDPDLLVVINFPRAAFANVVPPNVPYVCWLQDAMPHLFDPALGRAQTNLDFLAGHTFTDLFTKFEYPAARLIPISMVADPTKFHAGPVDPTLAAQHTCDIAFATHHSEAPQAMFERIRAELHHSPAIQQALTTLWPDIQRFASEAHTTCHAARLEAAVLHHLRQSLSRDPDQKSLTSLHLGAAVPLLDRILRHETLAWAADIAESHKLSLHIYGKGWHSHPRFSKYAKGELSHAEPLRASYNSAKLHLHVSGTTLTHQRIVECYLSGGLCLARLHRDAIAGPKTTTQLALADATPDLTDADRVGYTIADHTETLALASHLARINHPLAEPTFWINKRRQENQRRVRNAIAADHDPAFLLRDLEQTTFSTKAQLESLILRAVHNPTWRTNVNAMVARVARSHLTHDALATRLLSLIASSL